MADSSTLIVTNDSSTLVNMPTSVSVIPDTEVLGVVTSIDSTNIVVSTLEKETVVLVGAPGPAGPSGKSPEINPSFVYAGGKLVGVTYPSGNYKVFEYVGEVLTKITYYESGVPTQKVFYYNVDGSLQRIEETTL